MQEEKKEGGGHGVLSALLTRWSEESDKPIVLLLDEVDALVGDRQYPDLPAASAPQGAIITNVLMPFPRPWSSAVCGMSRITVSNRQMAR